MSSRSAKETKINSLMRRCSLHAWCTVTTQGQLKHFHKFLTRISQKRMPNLTNQTRATLQTGMTIVQKLTHKLKKMQFRVWSPDLRLNLSYQLQVVWISRLGSPILYATSIRMCKFLLWLNQSSTSWLNADAIVVQNLIWILETKRFFKCHWLWVFLEFWWKGLPGRVTAMAFLIMKADTWQRRRWKLTRPTWSWELETTSVLWITTVWNRFKIKLIRTFLHRTTRPF